MRIVPHVAPRIFRGFAEDASRMLVRPRLLSLLIAATIAVVGCRSALASRPVDAGCDRCDAARPVGSRLAPIGPAASSPSAPVTPVTPPRPGHKATLTRPHVGRAPQRAKTTTRQQPATPGMQMLLRLSTGSHTELSFYTTPSRELQWTQDGRGPPRAGPDLPSPAPSGAIARASSGLDPRADRRRIPAAPLPVQTSRHSAPALVRPDASSSLDCTPSPSEDGLRARRPEGAAVRHPSPSGGAYP